MSRIKLLTREQIVSDSEEFFTAINGQPELAIALIGSSWLDQILGTLLHSHFIKSSMADRFLNPERGTIGTFASRITLTYLLARLCPFSRQE